MATEYAKIENGRLVEMPLFTDGACNVSPERAAWRQENGYYPVDRSVSPPPCEAGKVPVRTGWDYDDPANPSAVVPVYAAVDIDDAPDHALRELVRSGTCRALTFDVKDKLLARIGRLVLLFLVSMPLFADPLASVSRFGDLVSDSKVVTGVTSARVSPLMWPGDWFIRIEGLEPQPGPASHLTPTNDVLALMAGGTGVWRGYRLSAEADPIAVRYGDPAPPVEFSVYDPSGAVASFTSNVLASSGVAGVAHVTGTDTNGVSREAAVVMTPVRPGRIVNLYASETNVTERYLWAANLFAKLAAVSTAETDLVANPLCRSFAERYEVWKYTTWKSARQLSRFGSDGRIRTNEWAGAMINSSTWADLATPTTARAWAFKQNRDFFWPALQTNLWCFSSACHEGHAAPPALGKDSNGNPINGYRSVPLMAVAPHYAVGAAHYGDWVLSPWQCHPRFVKSTNDNDYVLSHVDGAVGTVAYAHGNDSDIRLYRLTQTVPDQCIAHFATREVLQSLSPTLFRYVPCLTVNAHQVVTPYCLGGTGSTLYGWSAEPRTSTFTSPYPAGIAVPAQAADCVHMGHMYDSGDVFFLAAPNGRVVPLGQTKFLNDGGGLSGPSYLDDGILESLSAMIRADSGGAEDIKLWTFEDLYAGGVTNLTEVAQ